MGDIEFLIRCLIYIAIVFVIIYKARINEKK